RPEEQRAVVFHAVEKDVGIARHHLDVLGRHAVGLCYHLGFIVADDHLAVVLPGLAGEVGARQDLQQPLDLFHGVARKLFRIGDENGGRGWPVLGLAEQVGRAISPSTVSSAMIKVSVGPASRSMPTRPNSWRFASATYALPGPTSISTGAIV